MPTVTNGKNHVWSSNGQFSPSSLKIDESLGDVHLNDHNLSSESIKETSVDPVENVTTPENKEEESVDHVENGNGALKTEELDYISKSPVKAVDGSYLMPGAVPQEAA